MSRRESIRLGNGRASCTLWLEGCPSYAGLATACIGGLRCDDLSAGRVLLDQAVDELTRLGFEYVIGPMDGNTWHSYRLVIESDGSAPFRMEPVNPAFLPEAFAGFDVIGRYSSARASDPRRRNIANYERRAAQAGIRIRNFDPHHSDRDLLAIYRLSSIAFARNFLYTPISDAAFMDLYRPLLGQIDPRLVLLAEDDCLQACLFAIPDGNAAIVKTYASLRPGLGACLLERLQAGPAAGYGSVIHALMHDDNVSMHNSAKYALPFRRYALYGRRL